MSVLALVACGSNASNEKLELDPVAKSNEQSFDEPFIYDNAMINSDSKLKITVSNHEVVGERHAEERQKDDTFAHFDVRYVEGEFKPAELRPGGKNEGYIYIPIEEGTIPSEMIFFETTSKMLMQYADQFVFNIKTV